MSGIPDPTDKLAADQFVNHRAGYNAKVESLLAYLERNPFATLASGEGRTLAEEVHRLRRCLSDASAVR